MPFLLLGSLVSCLIEAFVDQERLSAFFTRNPFIASLIGTVMGLAFPVCECGACIANSAVTARPAQDSIATIWSAMGATARSSFRATGWKP